MEEINMPKRQTVITGAASTVTDTNLTANAAVITDANGKLTASGVISVAELNTLNGCTSKVQTQIDNLKSSKADIPETFVDYTYKPTWAAQTDSLITSYSTKDDGYVEGSKTAPIDCIVYVRAYWWSSTNMTTLGWDTIPHLYVYVDDVHLETLVVRGEVGVSSCIPVFLKAGQTLKLQYRKEFSDGLVKFTKFLPWYC